MNYELPSGMSCGISVSLDDNINKDTKLEQLCIFEDQNNFFLKLWTNIKSDQKFKLDV